MGTGATAADLRARAAASRQEARDSFERCDTDGFLSQWASGINARLYEQQALIAEAGGTALFAKWVLTDAAGETVDARVVETRYGTKWRIDATDEWIKYGSARAAFRRGYEVTEVFERAEAAACIAANGTGLSGAASAYVRTYRKDAQRSDGWRCVGIEKDERS